MVPAGSALIGGTGATVVHIDSNDPLVSLYVHVGQSAEETGNRLLITNYGQLVCHAPCDVAVDGSRGDLFFLQREELRVGPAFRLREMGPSTRLRATIESPQNRSRQMGGTALIITGVLAGLAGLPMFILAGTAGGGDSTTSYLGVGGALLGGAALGLGIGIPLRSSGDMKYTVDVPNNLPPALQSIAILPPVPVPGGGISPVGLGLAFTF